MNHATLTMGRKFNPNLTPLIHTPARQSRRSRLRDMPRLLLHCWKEALERLYQLKNV